MWCAYAFACLALISLPQAIHGGTATLIAWIAQTFLQLVLLSIIMVGQKVAAQKSDRQLEQTYRDAEELLRVSDAIHGLLKQNTALTEEIGNNRARRLQGRPLNTVVDRAGRAGAGPWRDPNPVPGPGAIPAGGIGCRGKRRGQTDHGHQDWTDRSFVTLDPQASTDLDQAFEIRREGQDILLNYAIADVGFFVASGDLVDAEAWRRGTTIYLPDGKASLYSRALSEGAASLLPNVDRPAVVFSTQGRFGWQVHSERGDPRNHPVAGKASLRNGHVGRSAGWLQRSLPAHQTG